MRSWFASSRRAGELQGITRENESTRVVYQAVAPEPGRARLLTMALAEAVETQIPPAEPQRNVGVDGSPSSTSGRSSTSGPERTVRRVPRARPLPNFLALPTCLF